MMGVYRALKQGSAADVKLARATMLDILGATEKSDIVAELMHDEEIYLVYRYLPEMLRHALKQLSASIARDKTLERAGGAEPDQ
jgi:hypothetical protein